MGAPQSYRIRKIRQFVRRNLPQDGSRTGRPPAMTDIDLTTIIIWDGICEQHQTIRGIYDWIRREYSSRWPNLPTYETFLRHCHRLAPVLSQLLGASLQTSSPLVFADSTLLPVCANHKAGRYRTAQGTAKWGKNHQRWAFGFKLHLAVNPARQITALTFSPASAHDSQHMSKLVNPATDILVGDSHYGVGHWRKKLMRKYGVRIVAPPHYTQKQKLLTQADSKLLRSRSKVEAVFGLLKGRHSLVTSYPRSIRGYLVHYLRSLLGYQLGRLWDS